jgi:CHAT domain-containing protein
VYHKTLFRFCLPIVILSFSCTCLAQNNSAIFSSIASQSAEVSHRQIIAEEVLRLGLKGEYAQALDALSRAQQVAENNFDKPGVAMVTMDSVLIYFFQGNTLKALATYQKMPPIADIEHDKKALAHVLSRRAFLGYYRNGLAQALKDAERSLSLLNPATDKIEMGFTLNVAGMIYSALGNSQEALKALQQSLTICNQLADEFWLALPLNTLGYVYHMQNNEVLALKYYQQSLALSERYDIRSLRHYTLNNIGAAYLAEGNYTEALPYLQKSLSEREAKGKQDEISTTLRDIGSAYRDMSDYTKALEYYRKSLAIEELLQNPSKIAGRLLNISSIYMQQQNYALAFDCIQKSLKVAEANDDKEGIARCYMNMGDLHLVQNNYDLAMDYYQKALPLVAVSGHKLLAIFIRQSLGTAYREKGDYNQALSYFQQYLQATETIDNKIIHANLLLNIGLTYQFQGDYNKALSYYQKCLELNGYMGDKQLLCFALSLSGGVYYALGDYPKALEFAEQGYGLAKQLGNFHAIAYSRRFTARVFHNLQQAEKARQAYDEAIAATENIRTQVIGNELEQQRFFEKSIKPYYEIIALLIEQNKIDEAFAYAERAKARALLEVLQSGKINITKAMTAREQEQEQKLKNELFSINSQITRESLRQKPDQMQLPELKAKVQKARFNYEAFQNNLYAAHSELKVKRGETQPIKADETGTLLESAKTLLLEYVVTDEKTYLFAISKNSSANRTKIDVKVYAIQITGKELGTRAENFRKQLASRDIRFRESARQLYDLLLKPAQSELQGKNHIVIVPDGALWELPFQALQSQANRYFIEDAAISYTPSLSALRELIKRHSTSGKSPTLLAFGNPALSNETLERNRIARRDEKLHPLPEAEKEVKELAQLYGAENSRLYIGAAAREDILKSEASKFKILHLAAHGILNDANPMYSRIVLAQGETNEDGLLEAWEIMKLDLNADLVVLSACDTARGRIGAGEGVIGLTWALFVAGSPTTVVSQWKVDSMSTSQLMLDFHRNLKSAKPSVSKAEALRAASVKMLQSSEYKHPFYWAGFVIVGNGF